MKFLHKNSCLINKNALFATVSRLAPYIKYLKKIKSRYTYGYPESSIILPLDKQILQTVYKLKQKTITQKLRYFIVIGIGGSNLGTRAIYDALFGYYDAINPDHFPKFIFLDTVDPNVMLHIDHLLKNNITDISQLRINIISKSGDTTETIANFGLVYNILSRYFPKKNLKECLIITTDKGSRLFYEGKKNKINLLTIPPKVGGRFSVFSGVGMFPLAVMNIDLNTLQGGASSILKSTLNKYAAISAAILYLHYRAGKNINDNFFFHPQLESLGKWYRQLMAESIGKKHDLGGKVVNVGITPTVSIGTTDLHSLGQLYLGGPKDKITTFIYSSDIGTATRAGARLSAVDTQLHEHYGIQKSAKNKIRISRKTLFASLVDNLDNQTADDILEAIYSGVKIAYKKNKLPYMEILLDDISPYALAEFMQFKMIEIMYLGYLMNVNAFDQPNVESYKTETKKYLSAAAVPAVL